jgi:hypothetical protein
MYLFSQPHEDGPLFHPVVSTISLGSHTVLDFYDHIDKGTGDSIEIVEQVNKKLILLNEFYYDDEDFCKGISYRVYYLDYNDSGLMCAYFTSNNQPRGLDQITESII